eukprot:m.110088 g.110088  ORF g.110088 m.110088 type:complete len:199 (+) comp15261_c1_seq4:615-1211(+)
MASSFLFSVAPVPRSCFICFVCRALLASIFSRFSCSCLFHRFVADWGVFSVWLANPQSRLIVLDRVREFLPQIEHANANIPEHVEPCVEIEELPDVQTRQLLGEDSDDNEMDEDEEEGEEEGDTDADVDKDDDDDDDGFVSGGPEAVDTVLKLAGVARPEVVGTEGMPCIAEEVGAVLAVTACETATGGMFEPKSPGW